MRFIRLTPPRVILVSYLSLITVGTLLFTLLPTAKVDLSPVDALFTVTSAVTVTGLVVLDTGKDLTPLGQLLILLLIQIGGLGYMTLTTFFLVALRKKIGLKERMVLAESLNYPGLYGLVRFLRRVMLFVFLIEFIGFLLLFPHWLGRFGIKEALLLSLFHSVSAFNNAGFSLFSDSLVSFRDDLYTNLVMMLLIVMGGLGFFVINDIYLFLRKRVPMLSTHTKIVLLVNTLLILGSCSLLLITEAFHQKDVWSLPWGERIMSMLFLSVSSRTAGFNTIDLNALSESSLFLIILLMFIGASPGGTGGGIKTVTFATVILSVLSYIRGQREVVVFNRRIPQNQIHKAMVIITLSFFFVSGINLLVDGFEEKDFFKTMFEVVSAFSTTGLSLGEREGLSFSAELSPIGKLLIVISMIAGRVGILSFAVAMVGVEREARLKFPEARLLI